MYLYDYQLTLTRRIGRGGNFILHGPRRIGITTILLVSALRKASRYDCSNILFLTSNQALADNARKDVFDFVYASKVMNVSPFEDGFDIKQEVGNKIIFNNEATVDFWGINSEWPIRLEHEPKRELIVLDNTAGYSLDKNELKQLLDSSDQIVMGASSSVDDGHFIHQLWHDSILGKNDFNYVRIPLSVSKNPNMYTGMKGKLSKKEWLSDVELVHDES